jgi:hypothetical protein
MMLNGRLKVYRKTGKRLVVRPMNITSKIAIQVANITTLGGEYMYPHGGESIISTGSIPAFY